MIPLIYEIMTIASNIANVIKELSEIIEPVSIIIAFLQIKSFLQIQNLVKKKKKKTKKRKKNRKKKKTAKKAIVK